MGVHMRLGPRGTTMPVCELDYAAGCNLAFTATSRQSAVIPTDLIRIAAVDADCYYAIGVNPVAKVTSAFLPYGAIEFVAFNPAWRVAALQVSSGGTLNIIPARRR